jgi:hypothetical protein
MTMTVTEKQDMYMPPPLALFKCAKSYEVMKRLLGYAHEQVSFPEFHLILVCLGMTAMAFWSRFSR